jgi:hypothetical protein
MYSARILAGHLMSLVKTQKTTGFSDEDLLEAAEPYLEKLRAKLERSEVLENSIRGCEYRLFSEGREK